MTLELCEPQLNAIDFTTAPHCNPPGSGRECLEHCLHGGGREVFAGRFGGSRDRLGRFRLGNGNIMSTKWGYYIYIIIYIYYILYYIILYYIILYIYYNMCSRNSNNNNSIINQLFIRNKQNLSSIRCLLKVECIP